MTVIEPSKKVAALVAELANRDPSARQLARESLVALRSNEVTAALVAELNDPRQHVRWEAAKALAAIADPVTTPALVQALEDDSDDVRWLAAEGLVALGESGVLAVLSALIKRAASVPLCESAHHVLRACDRGPTAENIAPVLAALSEAEPGVSVPPAAYAALLRFKVGAIPAS